MMDRYPILTMACQKAEAFLHSAVVQQTLICLTYPCKTIEVCSEVSTTKRDQWFVVVQQDQVQVGHRLA